MKPKGKKWLVIGLVVLIPLVGFLIIRFFIPKYLPHQRIIISLPFATVNDQSLLSINPMGERVYHPKAPHGHPGIDFQWDHSVEMIATTDVMVTSIKTHRDSQTGQEPSWDVETVSGIYAVRYQEIVPSQTLKVGDHLKKGQMLGRTSKATLPNGPYPVIYNVHWEFDYDSPTYDRLCPQTYFDTESQERIDNLWSKVGNTYDGKYPDLCSGDYTDRND